MSVHKAEIRLNGLSKNFGAVRALENVSLLMRGGTIHGVVGPNGAGKTTLLRLLAGLFKSSSGSVETLLNGGKPGPQALKEAVAYFPQEQSLYPDLSCQEHLEFFRDLYGINAERFAERSARLLEISGLTRFRDRRAGQLSGGMYKKLGLACVLLHSPSILLLDEPTIGVDPISRREVWVLLQSFAREGMLVVLTTSYLDEAERCGRVALLENGSLLLEGEPSALLKQENAAGFSEIFLARTGRTK
ncbi:MAG TPA: ABC transporter ATP-binding protein [Elusimicrobiales bacterium]|nr:ABC transporter ATP-binding protein [Elusimicrobiales bacterium]